MLKKILLNLVIFQIGWLVAVLGGDQYAVLYTLLALAIHQWLILDHVSEWKLIGIIVVVGCAWDIAMAQGQLLIFPEAIIFGIPLWLICLWVLFATTFQHCLRWMHTRLYLAALFAAIFGPLSYWSGTQISNVKIGEPMWLSILIIGVGWMVLFPGGLHLAQKWQAERRADSI